MSHVLFERLLLKITSLALLCAAMSCQQEPKEKPRPNIVLIMLDDGAFADFAPFGDPHYPTPRVNALAETGTQFHSFYVPQAISSASRAALMTGCYPGRTGVFSAHAPREPGLDPEFATMGEVFKQTGYATACFGKWHLGDQDGRRPQSRGFDESCGLMYSNDMWKHHPGNPEFWGQWPLQYWENGETAIDSVSPEDQKKLTRWYTEHAVDFINRHAEEPFFLYVPHSMPHVPLYRSKDFEGKSGTGVYGDVMMELDWSVGQIMTALDKNGLREETIVVFIGSDNGPWLSYGNRAGNTPYREGKTSIFDGGVRNPCIISYPGHMQADTASNRTFCSVDLLPTLCHLTNTPLPGNTIDGKNVWDFITHEPGTSNPHAYYPLSRGSNFQGIISGDGRWKLHLKHPYWSVTQAGQDGQPGKSERRMMDTTLFEMGEDPYEKKGNVMHAHPEIARKMIKLAKQHEARFYSKKSTE